MINLPHRLDLVFITTIQGGLSRGYRFSNPASTTIPKDGEYLINRGVNPVSRRFTTSLTIPLIDADNQRLPTDLPFNSTIQIQFRSLILGQPVNRLLNALVTFDQTDNVIVLTVLGSDEGFQFSVDDINIVFLIGGAQLDTTRLIGVRYATINCLVNPLTRSLDRQYFERYQILTNHTFFDNRRDIYLTTVDGEKSGLPDNIQAIKTERISTSNNLTQIIARTYPENTTDRAIDTETFEYQDRDGNPVVIDVPRFI